MTIHKSQGGTYDAIVYEYDRKHPRELVYVALTRITRIQGLFLVTQENIRSSWKFWIGRTGTPLNASETGLEILTIIFSKTCHLSERLLIKRQISGPDFFSNYTSFERQPEKAWDKLWPDLEGEKDFNDDHKEEITDFVQSIPGFQECDEGDVETWMACDAEDCGFKILNDDQIVTPVQKESNPVDDERDEDEGNNNESSKGPSMLTRFLR
ncbi:hypothetical protein TNCV_2993971 [Trichonephila clavipes]|nr:hypothetical protein TNCV_2993971 [Trichonephila clavipes]